jgi:hypothetical protein
LRHSSCLVPRRRPRLPQFGLRGFLIWVAILSLFLAIGLYSLVMYILAIAFVAFGMDWCATYLAHQGQPAPRTKVTQIPRFWHGLTSTSVGWIIPEPVVVALVYIYTFIIWHMFMFITWNEMSIFFDTHIAPRITLRALDHVVNGTMLGYLLAHLFVRLFSHHDRQRQERIPIILTIAVVAAMHFAIP